MNGQEYLDLLKTRYSVRSFSDVQLTDAELDVLLQAAQLSPTAKNSLPLRCAHGDNRRLRYRRVSEGARL